MKPFPPELQEQYPADYERYAPRPWWRRPYLGPDTRFTWERRTFGRNGEWEALCIARTDEPGWEAFMEAKDREDPIPFPGLRVGQVWWVEPIAHLVDHPKPVQMFESPGVIQLADSIMISRFYQIGRFVHLLHDPVCPWFAPWSAE